MGKRIQSKCKFSDFCLIVQKLAKFLMSFFKPQVVFLLNFALLPFSVMTHNPSKIFKLRHISFGQKEPINIHFFRFLSAVMKVHSIAIFKTKKVRVYSNFASLFSVMKDNSSVFFSSNLIYFGQK